jgi:hypothetical protein
MNHEHQRPKHVRWGFGVAKAVAVVGSGYLAAIHLPSWIMDIPIVRAFAVLWVASVGLLVVDTIELVVAPREWAEHVATGLIIVLVILILTPIVQAREMVGRVR